MSDFTNSVTNIPPEQQRIRVKCFHPSGSFVEFKKEEIEQSIPDRFEKIVRLYPDRIAVKTRTRTLTYTELNAMANRVARTILAQRPEGGNEPIALLLENDAPTIAAILGVLKAGKMYVPLDPSLPRARLAYILEDSQAGLTLTNTRNLAMAADLSQEKIAWIDVDRLDRAPGPENVGLPISPDTLTWILYTSGSTGQPKGVVQNHRNVLHFVMNYTSGLHISAEDRLTLLFSCSVNGAAHDIFSALLNGASLYPVEIKKEGVGRIAKWLLESEITIYCSVPTVFRHFCETLTEEKKFSHLRLIKLIGEPVLKRDVEFYKKCFSQSCVFVNRLGSTETGTIRWHFIDREAQISGNNVPVGYPVEDNEILLLENGGKEVGFNQVGEIAVRSHYLTPGYFRRPDLTEKAFVADPEGGDGRIYRTGDLGCMLPDGCLVHLGRKDSQVKIRGHRVELAEIEMALLDLDAIEEAVVAATEDQAAGQSLVAYIVLAGKSAPTVSDLRNFLREKLPDYMIPSNWLFLDALPLAPNGKVDRRALPDPDNSRPYLDTPYAAPRTPVEVEVEGIWREVLSLDRIGVHDNFFDLGGHSLAATRVVSQVIKKFQIEIPFQSLFQSPTVAETAAVIADHQGKELRGKELDRILTELESLTNDEAESQLAGTPHRTGDGCE